MVLQRDLFSKCQVSCDFCSFICNETYNVVQLSYFFVFIDLAQLDDLFHLGGKQATNKDEIRGIHWATWTGVLGPEVNGIWEKYTDTNDINATDAYFGGESVVTGDDFGLVKLFRFPSLKKGRTLVKR